MNYIFWAEKIILKKSKWKIYSFYSCEIIDLIINEIIIKKNYPFSKDYIKNYKEIVNTFLTFSLEEYSIYSKYNQIIISLVCLIIGISYSNGNNEKLKEKDLLYYQNILKKEILNLNITNNEKIFDECQKDIIDLLENNEDEEIEDDSLNLVLTRSSSTNSLIESFFINNKENVNLNNNNIDNKNDNLLFIDIKESESLLLGKKRYLDDF
jgi:hypothetical protein